MFTKICKGDTKIIEVYTDANPKMVCIAIEKPEKRIGFERRFDLIVLDTECDEFFEANAIRLALTYIPDKSDILLHCDKEGDIVAIQKGKSSNKEFQDIITQIKTLETEKSLSIEYVSVPRKENYSGRILEKVQ